MKPLRFSLIVLSGLVLSAGMAQDTDGEFASLKTASYYLAAVNGSGVNGDLQVSERSEGGTLFTLTLTGITPGERYEGVLFQGDCGPDGTEVMQLEAVSNIAADPYASRTESDKTFADISENDYFLYIYDATKSTILSCGEVGQGANASTLPPAQPTPPAPDTTNETTGQAPDDEQASIMTASFALSPVNNSGISGNLQIRSSTEGGSVLTISLNGNDETGDYAATLYEGNCGPNHPEFLSLNNINASDGVTNSSITETELGFDVLMGRDLFLYVFADGDTSTVVTCGEVGQTPL